MKKKILLIGFLIIIAFFTIALITNGKTVNRSSQITLNIWVMPNSENAEKDYQDLFKPFTKANPNIKVVPNIIDWGSALIKIKAAALGASDAPDLVEIGSTWVAEVAETGGLTDLKKNFDFAKFLPGTLASTGCVGKNEKTSIPWCTDTRMIIYRKDACQAAGVNPQKDFDNWDSFKNALKKLNQVEVNGKKLASFGTSGKADDWDVVHNFAWWLWGAGGDYLSSEKKSMINTSESFQGIKFFTNLAKDNLIDQKSLLLNSWEIQSGFARGDYAIIIAGGYTITGFEKQIKKNPHHILKDNFGVAIIPAGPKGRYAFFGSNNLSILKTSKNKAAALKLLNYMITNSAQIDLFKKTGLLPAIKSAYNDPYISENKIRKTFKAQFKYGRAYPSIPEWGTIENQILKSLSDMWIVLLKNKFENSDQLIKNELNKAASAINKIIQE